MRDEEDAPQADEGETDVQRQRRVLSLTEV
jgi:hypothetical protein